MIETTLGQNKELPTIKGNGADEIQCTAYKVSGNLETGHLCKKPGFAGQVLKLFAPGPCRFEFHNTIAPQVPNEDDKNVIVFPGTGYASFVAQMTPDGNGPEVLGWWLVDSAGCDITFG